MLEEEVEEERCCLLLVCRCGGRLDGTAGLRKLMIRAVADQVDE